jgi:hypothetical protein
MKRSKGVILLLSIVFFIAGCSMQDQAAEPLRVLVRVDETSDTALIFDGHVAGLIEDLEEHSDFFRDFIESQPSGPVHCVVVNSKDHDKILGMELIALLTDQTSDGYIHFMVEAIDVINDFYAFNVRYVYRPYKPEGYSLELDAISYFNEYNPAARHEKTGRLSISGSYTATKTWGNLVSAGSWWSGDNSAKVTVTDINLVYRPASVANEDTPEVACTVPADESIGVAVNSTVIVNFDQPMDESTAGLIVNGELVNGTWNTPTQLEYIPGADFPALSRIWVIVPMTLKSLEGDPLALFEEFYFDTL